MFHTFYYKQQKQRRRSLQRQPVSILFLLLILIQLPIATNGLFFNFFSSFICNRVIGQFAGGSDTSCGCGLTWSFINGLGINVDCDFSDTIFEIYEFELFGITLKLEGTPTFFGEYAWRGIRRSIATFDLIDQEVEIVLDGDESVIDIELQSFTLDITHTFSFLSLFDIFTCEAKYGNETCNSCSVCPNNTRQVLLNCTNVVILEEPLRFKVPPTPQCINTGVAFNTFALPDNSIQPFVPYLG